MKSPREILKATFAADPDLYEEDAETGFYRAIRTAYKVGFQDGRVFQRKLKPLSPKEQERRRPSSPASRIDALQDTIHLETGNTRVPKSMKVKLNDDSN